MQENRFSNIYKINKEDVYRILSTVIESDNEVIEKYFKKYNENKNSPKDYINFIKEVKPLLHELTEDFTEKRNEQVLKEALSTFNINIENKIEYTEFEKLIKYLIDQKGYHSK